MSNPKPWYTSKTLWWNVLTIVLAILGFLMTTAAQGGLPFHIDTRYLVLVAGVVNILLRCVTTQPLTGGKP